MTLYEKFIKNGKVEINNYEIRKIGNEITIIKSDFNIKFIQVNKINFERALETARRMDDDIQRIY